MLIVGAFCAHIATANSTDYFVANVGQVRDQSGKANPAVRYLLQGAGNNVAVRGSGFSYDTYTITESVREGEDRYEHLPEQKAEKMLKRLTYHFHRIDIDFVGADANATVEALDQLEERLHFYTSEVPVTDVRSFRRVVMRNVWPNIDVEFRSGDTFEYDFILHPGADINDIELRYSGMDKAELKDGGIAIHVVHGQLIERIPMSYFRRDQRAVDIHYELRDSGSDAVVIGFTGHSTPITEILVIDPTPNRDWGTFYGGANHEDGYGIAADAAGNVIATGFTNSTTAIATAGAHQVAYVASWDTYAVKFNPLGVRQWATYLGGSGDEYGHGVRCDPSNNIYLTGYCGASAFIASAGAHQTVFGGGNDAYLVKLNASGVRQWGTYYGGNCWDYGHDLALEPGTNNVYMYGQTCTLSGAAITTPGAYQTTSNGSWTGLLSKWTPAGVRIWATFFGGPGVENGNSVAVDNAGNVVIAGSTSSTTGIASAGAYQAAWAGGCCFGDAYFAKFNSAGVLQWSTYYGGASDDVIWEVDCDAANNIIVGGFTYTTGNMFGTAGTYDATFAGLIDGVVSKFSPTGTRVWGTYIGGADEDVVYALDVQPNSDIIVTGHSLVGPIATGMAPQLSCAGNADAIFMRLNPNGTREWGTWYGGSDFDSGWDVVAYGNNVVYGTGTARSLNNMTTVGAHQTVNGGGGQDAFIVRYSDANIPLPIELISFTAIAQGSDLVLTQWSTAAEINNDRFTVERSTDGEHFTAVGEVDGAGHSQSTLQYEWVDTDPLPGLSYYRLRQTDFDGTSTTSDAMPVMRGHAGRLTVMAVGPSSISIALDRPSHVEVLDATGKVVMRSTFAEGTSMIDASGWPAGVYQVVAAGEEAWTSARCVLAN